jgi:hypothetical protein
VSATNFYNNYNNANGANITNAQIPDAYNTNGQYLWFWVTWKLNVNAYLDLFSGDLPADATDAYQTPQNQKDIYFSFIMAKEHFPFIPGRTTVLETRTVYEQYTSTDTGHGALGFGQGPAEPVPPRRD